MKIYFFIDKFHEGVLLRKMVPETSGFLRVFIGEMRVATGWKTVGMTVLRPACFVAL